MTTFDLEDLNQCISCGLCVGACPTYRVTGLETSNPRGRIEAMRAVADGSVSIEDETFGAVMEECVQCRACEAVCPSLAPFGALMEEARAVRHDVVPRSAVRRIVGTLVFRLALPTPFVLRLSALVVALLQLLRVDRLLPATLRVPVRVRARDALRPLRARSAPAGAPSGSLFRGCVMDHWMRPVHQDAVDVLAAAGVGTTWPEKSLCCGALHLHQGRREEARALARRVIGAFADAERIVVDSAGCGAALKEYGHLLGTDEARAFSAKVVDFSEVDELTSLPPAPDDTTGAVGYQHACHLRNVQGITAQPLALIRTVAGCEVVEGDEPGVCCGAGGAYSVVQPELARAIRDRKAADLAGLSTVVTTNPGCQLHLAGAGLPMEHLATFLARRLRLGRFHDKEKT